MASLNSFGHNVSDNLNNDFDTNLDLAWENYLISDGFDQNCSNLLLTENSGSKEKIPQVKPFIDPEFTSLYISTKTVIAYLSSPIDLYDVFWKIPILNHHIPHEGVIKKDMKVNSKNKEEFDDLEEKISLVEGPCECNILVASRDNTSGIKKSKYYDVRKISVGMSNNDVVTSKKKKKSAFYNCFVLLFRLKYQGTFKELHIKVFNTGKLEIPGIKDDTLLHYALNKLINVLTPIVGVKLFYDPNEIHTVLINSNFQCNFGIDRQQLFNIMRHKYSLNVRYDPCTYPGIQCKYTIPIEFLVGHKGKKTGGKLSFMIFRTGSVLIVGHTTESVLYKVYEFIKTMLKDECQFICTSQNDFSEKKQKKKKNRKKTILVTHENTINVLNKVLVQNEILEQNTSFVKNVKIKTKPEVNVDPDNRHNDPNENTIVGKNKNSKNNKNNAGNRKLSFSDL